MGEMQQSAQLDTRDRGGYVEQLPINVSKRTYAEFNRARITRMNGKIAVHRQTANLDKVMAYAHDEASRTRDLYNDETPDAMEAQVYLEWLRNGKKF